MKKISVLIAVIFLMSFMIVPVTSVQAKGMDDVIRNVEKTNKEISEEIQKAVADAQKVLDNYSYNLMSLEKGKEVAKIERELAKLERDLNEAQRGTKKYEKVLKDIEKSKEKIQRVQEKYESKSLTMKNEINELDLQLNLLNIDSKDYKKTEENLRKTLTKYNDVYDENFQEVQKLEDKYIEELDKIINDLLNVTNKKAGKMVEDAGKEGIIIICEWVDVKLGDRNVLVDPLRIANR
jgi:chromosome segregation ATPase